MTKRKNPSTSTDALKSLKAEELRETYKGILAALSRIKEGTFEQIAQSMRAKPDKIWKRLSELAFQELIYRPGNKRILKSGRMGYTWMLTEPGKEKLKNGESLLPGPSISDYSKKLIPNKTQEILF